MILDHLTDFNIQCKAGNPPAEIPGIPGSTLVPVVNGYAAPYPLAMGVPKTRTQAFYRYPMPHDPNPAKMDIKIKVVCAYQLPSRPAEDSYLGMIETQIKDEPPINEGWYILEKMIDFGVTFADVGSPLLQTVNHAANDVTLKIEANQALYKDTLYGVNLNRTTAYRVVLKNVATPERQQLAALLEVRVINALYKPSVDPLKPNEWVIVGEIETHLKGTQQWVNEGWYVLEETGFYVNPNDSSAYTYD